MPEGPDENGKIWIDRVKSKIKKIRHKNKRISPEKWLSPSFLEPTEKNQQDVIHYHICGSAVEAIWFHKKLAKGKVDTTKKKVTCRRCREILEREG